MNFIFLIVLSLFQFHAYAAPIYSSWLYCSDNNREYSKKFELFDFATSWGYASSYHTEKLKPYQSFVIPTYYGILIKSIGFKKISVFERKEKKLKLQEFAIVNYKFKSRKNAQKFCRTLEQKCRNDFKEYEIDGAEYSAVGYGESNSRWRGIWAESSEGGVPCKYKFPE